MSEPTTHLDHIECVHCPEAWDAEDKEAAVEHSAENFHDVELVNEQRLRIDSILMALDDEPDLAVINLEVLRERLITNGMGYDDIQDLIEATTVDDEPYPDEDDGWVPLDGPPRLICVMVPGVSLTDLGRLGQLISDDWPGSVLKPTDRGWEVWTKPE